MNRQKRVDDPREESVVWPRAESESEEQDGRARRLGSKRLVGLGLVSGLAYAKRETAETK